MSRFALVGARIFDGERIIDGVAVIVADGRIDAIVPLSEIGAGVETRRIRGLLAPGFIDVQVNGGGGTLFNDARTVDGIRQIGAAHRRFGTTGFLPTFITDTRRHMAGAVEAARQGLQSALPGLLGIHLEGPFLNPERRGVHDPHHMRPVEEADLRIMSSLGAGRTLLTLAPEMVPPGTIERLVASGVIVCAGHTMADVATLKRARAEGMRGFTHLYNAMPPLAGRMPGPVGVALSERSTWCGIIADLHHVDPIALSVAIAAKGTERMMLVTDAMATVGSEIDSFDLLGRTVFRRGGRLTVEDGTLAGSDLDMATAVRNAVGHLGLRVEAALAMASRVPAEFLGLHEELGRIAPGHHANLVLLDESLTVQATWVDGHEEWCGSEAECLVHGDEPPGRPRQDDTAQ